MAQHRENIILPKLYRNLSIIFFIITCVLAAGVFYFIYGRVMITVHPVFQKVTAEINIDIKKNPLDGLSKDAYEVKGQLYEFFVEDKVSVPASGTKLILDDTLGSVRVINNHTQDMTLVAATRLLAPDKTLLRLKERIQIPKGGRVSARVYPDKPETFTEIKPARFTIPGLAKDLQEKIYAESSATLTREGKKVTIVSEADRNLIEKKILERIDEKANETLVEKMSDEEALFTKLIQKEITEKSFSVSVGDESDTLDAKVDAKITAVVFDELSVVNIMKQKLSGGLSAGKELQEADTKSFVYSLDKYDIGSGIAKIKVYGEGRAVVRSESELFDKKKLFGKSESDIIRYFKSFKEVESVVAEFFPSWLRRAPRFEDRIEITVE